MSLLAKARRLRTERQKRASQVQRTHAQKQAEAQLDRNRRGSTDRPKIEDYWKPSEGPQAEFFHSTCREILYGGAAGGGKSSALTALHLKWCHIPGYLGLTLRRTYPQGKQLRLYSKRLYREVFPGLKPIKSEGYLWTFPSGAEATYGHCKDEDSHEGYDGWEINCLCFDELTHFTETQYKYLCARVRSSNPDLPEFIRATSNPGGPGHEWVFRHWGPWLDPEFEGEGLEPRFEDGKRVPPAKPGEVLWVVTTEGVESYHRREVPGSLSRTFIPASTADNPYLEKTYILQLEMLDAVRRAQLRDGNWLAKASAGDYFKREWVEVVPRAPDGIRWVRYWDFAGTKAKDHTKGKKRNDPDWTVGVLIGVLGSTIYVGDVIRRRDTPGVIKKLVLNTAQADGVEVAIGIPEDPGSAGKFQVSDFVSMLQGFIVLVERESGDKLTRFLPFSSQAEHGFVKVVKGPWNKAYFEELEAFPTPGIHDDQVDATSGGFQRAISGAANFLDAMSAIESRGGRVFG